MEYYIYSTTLEALKKFEHMDVADCQAIEIAVEADSKIHQLNNGESVGFNKISIMSPTCRDFKLRIGGKGTGTNPYSIGRWSILTKLDTSRVGRNCRKVFSQMVAQVWETRKKPQQIELPMPVAVAAVIMEDKLVYFTCTEQGRSGYALGWSGYTLWEPLDQFLLNPV